MARSPCDMSVGHFSERGALIFHLLVLGTYFWIPFFSASSPRTWKLSDLRVWGGSLWPPRRSARTRCHHGRARGESLTIAVSSSESRASYGHWLPVLARSTSSPWQAPCAGLVPKGQTAKNQTEQLCLSMLSATEETYHYSLFWNPDVMSCKAWQCGVRLGVPHRPANRMTISLRG